METLNISDGTTMQITRLPDIDDETWAEVKKYVETNPDTAKAMQNFAKNPDAMRGWLQTQAIAEHYSTKLSNGDTPGAGPREVPGERRRAGAHFWGYQEEWHGGSHEVLPGLGLAINTIKRIHWEYNYVIF